MHNVFFSFQVEENGQTLFVKDNLFHKAKNSDIRTTEKQSYKFTCTICSAGFNTKHSLYNHSRLHINGRSPSCNKCGKLFRYYMNWRYHQDVCGFRRRRRRTHKCSVCPASYASQSALICHKKIHQEGGLRCDKCDKQFWSYSPYTQHIKICGQNSQKSSKMKRFRCNLCRASYAWPTTLSSHRKIHQKGGLRCENCNKQFWSDSAHKWHIRSCKENIDKLDKGESGKQGSNKSCCAKCKEVFKNEQQLIDHLHIHSQKNSTICNKCDQQFSTNSILRRHQKKCKKLPKVSEESFFNRTINGTQSNPDEVKHKCTNCKIDFWSKNSFKNHMLMHKKALDPICKSCGRKFIFYNSVMYHKKFCKQAKPLKPKPMAKGSLCVDRRAKKKQCNECGQNFPTTSMLFMHRKKCTKLNLKPCSIPVYREDQCEESKPRFKCSHCDLQLSSGQSLCNHVRIHTKAVDPVCESCGKKNILYSTVMYHKKHCTPEKPVRIGRPRRKTHVIPKRDEPGHQGSKREIKLQQKVCESCKVKNVLKPGWRFCSHKCRNR